MCGLKPRYVKRRVAIMGRSCSVEPTAYKEPERREEAAILVTKGSGSHESAGYYPVSLCRGAKCYRACREP
jgi:hypothetical protein